MLDRLRWLWSGHLGVGIAAALLAGCAQMPPRPPDARAERLGELFAQAVPVGEVVRVVAERNPRWPVHDLPPGKVTPEQTRCLRAELTPEKVAAFQRADARRFVERHPGQADEAIRILSHGGAELFGKLIMAGGQEELTGQRANARAIMQGATPGQLKEFMQLTTGAGYADLRQALRIDGITSSLGDEPATARQRGRRAGQAMVLEPLLTAMETCKVPSSTLF
ncbi:MAG: hypothetical protein QM772_16285 [Ottowia sp.]|uniref:hypothetical protein n=1 Tax=Ottowia sp. TaxID=1898956 RepID=UPI0039E30567